MSPSRSRGSISLTSASSPTSSPTTRRADTMESLHYLTLFELAAQLESQTISPVEVTRQILDRIDALDGSLHSYVSLLPESALGAARKAELEIARGAWRGPLHGVPVAVKDLCATKGVRTTCGTRVYRDWLPDFDACVIEKLKAAGAVLLGKLAMTEGASAVYRRKRNPTAYSSTQEQDDHRALHRSPSRRRDGHHDRGGSQQQEVARRHRREGDTGDRCRVSQWRG